VIKPVQRRRAARQRLLKAADELFYSEGIHAVGIDRVIAHAGVAKGSLYYSFSGKDELVREYLRARHGKWAERVGAEIEVHTDPRERILAVYDALGALLAEPDYRGCAFMNAMAEAGPDSVEAQAATTYRSWVRTLFLGLVTDAGAADPKQLAERLVVLYDGAVATAQMDKTPQAAQTARRTAEIVLDCAGVRARRGRRPRG
jgi:AcrR family transcriptional regulator